MDRLLAVAYSYLRALQSPTASLVTSKFWSNRFFEIASEEGLSTGEALDRFEAFIAVGYWSGP